MKEGVGQEPSTSTTLLLRINNLVRLCLRRTTPVQETNTWLLQRVVGFLLVFRVIIAISEYVIIFDNGTAYSSQKSLRVVGNRKYSTLPCVTTSRGLAVAFCYGTLLLRSEICPARAAAYFSAVG